MSNISLRAPSTSITPSTTTNSFTAPPIPWVEGTWYVTHSTLPMWKKARNVAITYAALSPATAGASPSDSIPKLDDKVTYQSHTSDKIKTVKGVDTPAGNGSWDWRGSGWLMIASSHWEVLGYGGEEGGDQWVVTYFAKTLFTPAGIDVYSRRKEGLGKEILEQVLAALKGVEDPVVKGLADEVFVVKSDHY